MSSAFPGAPEVAPSPTPEVQQKRQRKWERIGRSTKTEARPVAAAEPASVRREAEFLVQVQERPADSHKLPFWIVGLIVLAFLVAGHFLVNSQRADPSYVKAVKLVTDFERAKPPDAINFHDPTYAEALDLLAGVDWASASAADAEALSLEIRRKQREFAARLHQEQLRIDAERAATEARDAALLEAQQTVTGTDPYAAVRAAAVPAPECEEGHDSRRKHAREKDQ